MPNSVDPPIEIQNTCELVNVGLHLILVLLLLTQLLIAGRAVDFDKVAKQRRSQDEQSKLTNVGARISTLLELQLLIYDHAQSHSQFPFVETHTKHRRRREQGPRHLGSPERDASNQVQLMGIAATEME